MGSGLEREHGPLTAPNGDAEFVGKLQAKLGWHTLRNYVAGETINLGNYISTESSVSYLQSFITMPVSGTYHLSFAHGGACKLYIDDALVYEQDEELAYEVDHIDIQVPLSTGAHRVVVKLGAAEYGRMYFNLRVRDMDWQPVEAVTSSSSARRYTPNPGLKAQINTNGAFLGLESAISENETDLLSGIALARAYLHANRLSEARKLIEQLTEFAPLAFGVTETALDLYTREDDERGAEQVRGRLRESLPNHPVVVLEQIEEAADQDDNARTDKLIDKLEDFYIEGHPVVGLMRLSMAGKREENQEAIKILSDLRSNYPHYSNLLNIDYQVQANVFNQPLAARRALFLYLGNNFHLDTWTKLAKAYREAGKHKDALKIYEDLLSDFPELIGVRRQMVDTHVESEDYKDALIAIDAALLQAPDVANFHEVRGEVLQQLDRDDEAREAYLRALALYPNDFSLRAKLRELDGARPLRGMLDSISVDDIIEEMAGAFDDNVDHPIGIVADDVRRVVYPGGVTEAHYTLVYRILNEKGVDALKEYNLQGVKILKAEVIKPSGTHVDGERGYGTVVFSELEVGDHVHVSYRDRVYNSGKLFGHFWEKYRFDSYYPSARVRYQLLVPKGFDFQHQATGFELEPERETLGEFERYVWQSSDLPAVKSEPYMPAFGDIAKTLHLSTIDDWEFVTDWYDELSSSRTKPTDAVRAQVGELFPDGYEQLSEAERVQRIYDFITDDISYSSVSFRQSSHVPQKASKTLRTKLGDCKDVSTLFVAMAREVGVDADLVLTDTRNNGRFDMVLPSIEFNHCVVQLSDGEYLELTDQYLPRAAAEQALSGALVLPIHGVKSEIATVPQVERTTGSVTMTKATIDGKNVRLDRTSDMFGQSASSWRYSFHNESRDNQEATLRQTIAGSLDKSYVLGDYLFDGLAATGDTVTLRYAIDVEKAVSSLQGMQLVQLPWRDRQPSLDFLSAEQRNYDLCFWQYSNAQLEDETIRLVMPEGLTPVEMPQPVVIEAPGLTYHLSFELDSDALIAHRKFEITRDQFVPDEYAVVRKFFSDVAEADDQLIGFR